MGESNKSDMTKELDNYGVWVKKPPRTVSSETNSEFSVVDNTPFDSGDKALTTDELSALTAMDDFPADSANTEFSTAGENTMNEMENIDIDSFMDGADFSDANAAEEPKAEETKPSENETQEISLDEFLDGGVFESDDGGSAASERSEMESKEANAKNLSSGLDDYNSGSSNISIESNDFSMPDDITVSDAPTASDSSQEDFSDDAPLDIDLSFDDTSLDNSHPESTESSSGADFETIDLDSFDLPAAESAGISASSPSSDSATFSDGSESVDLSEFGFDINAPESSDNDSETQEQPADSSSPSTETEEVDLSEFGFDIDAPESSGDEEAITDSKQDEAKDSEEKNEDEKADFSQAEDVSFDEIPSLSDENTETKNDETDLGSISFDEPAVSEESAIIETENQEPAIQDFTEPVIPSEEKIPEEKRESIEVSDFDNFSSASEIPDSFDEETASLFADEPETEVIEQGEPVFEETSVDISEIPEPDQNENAENSQNPFTLSPDGVFANQNFSEQNGENTVSEENGLENSKPVDSEEKAPHAISPAEAVAAETTTDEKIAGATAGKDADIAASTNSILSQIVSELASLKSEITGLRSEFEEIKSKETKIPQTGNSSGAEGDTGFFSENGEDDTIALSVDELDDILNNVEMVNEDNEEKKEVSEESEDSSKENVFSQPDTQSEISAGSPAEEIFEEPKISELEETISDDEQNELLGNVSDKESTDAQNDILVPKVEEETTNETANEDTADNAAGENLSSDEAVFKDEEPLLSSEDLSIGDFSFDDGPKDENSSEIIIPEEAAPAGSEDSDSSVETVEEAAEPENAEARNEEAAAEDSYNPVENADTDSDQAELYQTETEPAGNLQSAEPDIFYKKEIEETSEQPEEKGTESTVDEPFEFMAENNSDGEAKNVAISNDELENLLAPDPSISESLTDANLDYLASDSEIGKTESTEENPASSIPGNLQKEIKSVLSYMDQLLENLPEEKIAEFAQSEQFETYKKLFKELGLDK